VYFKDNIILYRILYFIIQCYLIILMLFTEEIKELFFIGVILYSNTNNNKWVILITKFIIKILNTYIYFVVCCNECEYL
jgi:hypothetical protein